MIGQQHKSTVQIHYSDEFFIILFAVTTGYCEKEWIGDGNCDDVNNNEDCQWDGGDCCGNSVNTQYCQVCACLDPGAGDSGTTTITTGPTNPTTTGSKHW